MRWGGEGGVSQGDAVSSDGFTLRTLETVNVGLDHGGLALPGEGGGLLLPGAGALGLVEDEGWRAVVDVGVAVHAVVVFVAHFRVLVVEEAVSSVAASV